MKKTLKYYIKIALAIAIIAGLFMPYVYGVLPINILFEDSNDLITILSLTVPLMVTVPFLLILIFKNVLKDSILSVLKPLFLIVYVIILLDYCYGIYNSYGSWIFDESLVFLISIILSLILILLNLKYAIIKSDTLENILLSIIGLPIILYFTFGLRDAFGEMNYGYFITSISFMILYIMAIFEIFKNRHHKKTI